MREYPKIQSVFKRGEEKPRYFIEGDWSVPEFEYLQNCSWCWTEKIDGTNTRVGWNNGPALTNTASTVPISLTRTRSFGGRTEDAQIPTRLLTYLEATFPEDKLKAVFPDASNVVLFGEGYGQKIQSGGKYIPDGVGFILFDVLIGDWWLQRASIEDVAAKLGIRVVPIVGQGTLNAAIGAIKSGVKSTFGDFLAEGLVLRPMVDLRYRNGDPILTKIKHKDFLR